MSGTVNVRNDDHVYSVESAKFELGLFTAAESKELQVLEGGAHFLSATKTTEVERAMVGFVDAKMYCIRMLFDFYPFHRVCWLHFTTRPD